MTNRASSNRSGQMAVLPEAGVLRFRVLRQMLATETRGCGQTGVLNALRVTQPAYTGLRWLGARMESPGTEGWHVLWEEGAICRARFLRGTLGCVLREDLDLYLNACAKGMPPLVSNISSKILSILKHEQFATTEELQMRLHVARSQLRQALADLGLMQLVMEAPRDTWMLTVRNGSGAKPGSEEQFRAQAEVIRRFLTTYGPATTREFSDRYGWPMALVSKVLSALVEAGIATQCIIEDISDIRYVCPEDIEHILTAAPLQPFVSILDCWDPLIRAQKTDLARRFGYGCSVPAYWHYILVNGEWLGGFRVHYKKKLLWIREMILDSQIMADDVLASTVFAAIRRLEPHPIRIDEVNGAPASFPANRDILEEHGYRLQDMYMQHSEPDL